MGAERSDLVMVVDDDPDVAALVVRTLRARGCRALGVCDPALALDAIAAAMPALVIVDQIVPSSRMDALVRALDDRGLALGVVLIRYAPGPAPRFRHLRPTVVAGERWFEQLPPIVARALSTVDRERPRD